MTCAAGLDVKVRNEGAQVNAKFNTCFNFWILFQEQKTFRITKHFMIGRQIAPYNPHTPHIQEQDSRPAFGPFVKVWRKKSERTSHA